MKPATEQAPTTIVLPEQRADCPHMPLDKPAQSLEKIREEAMHSHAEALLKHIYQTQPGLIRTLNKLRKTNHQELACNPIAFLKEQSPATLHHSLEVSILAVEIARTLNPELTQSKYDTIGLMGLMHDMGKVDDIYPLTELPRTLTEAERTLIDTHTTKGAEITDTILTSEGISENPNDAILEKLERVKQAQLHHHDLLPESFDVYCVQLADLACAPTDPFRLYTHNNGAQHPAMPTEKIDIILSQRMRAQKENFTEKQRNMPQNSDLTRNLITQDHIDTTLAAFMNHIDPIRRRAIPDDIIKVCTNIARNGNNRVATVTHR